MPTYLRLPVTRGAAECAHMRRLNAEYSTLTRADSGGGTQDFLAWLTKPGLRLACSVGFTLIEDVRPPS